MKRIPASIGMLSCGALLVGCDEAPTAIQRTVQSEIAVDVGALRAAARHTQEACVSPLSEIHLTVAMPNGRQEVLTRTLEPEPSVETFPVTVERGNVNFLVEVVSNNEMVLYRGSTTTEVRADGFTVPIVVQAVAPILQVCPEEVVLEPGSQCCRAFFAGNGFGGTFDVVNVGTDTLVWHAVAPSCDNEPCFGFDPEWDELLAGQTASVFIGANTARLTVPTTLPIRIESQTGFVELPVQVPPPPSGGLLRRGRDRVARGRGFGSAMPPTTLRTYRIGVETAHPRDADTRAPGKV